jgi:predicted transcriptional regulator
MYHKFHVPDAEYEVLEMLWKCGGEIKQSELLKKLTEAGKDWKRQTLNTLITRLEEKKLLERENRIVKAVYSRTEYSNLQMQENIDQLYSGKISRFFASFTEQQGISKEEAEEILAIIGQHFPQES